MIRAIKARHGLTSVALSERIGCDSDSIHNWENELTVMDPVVLLTVEDEFEPGTIDPVLDIAGRHCVANDPEAEGDVLPPLSSAVHRVATARAASSAGGPQETREELFEMEADLIEARRTLNRMLARIKRMRGG